MEFVILNNEGNIIVDVVEADNAIDALAEYGEAPQRPVGGSTEFAAGATMITDNSSSGASLRSKYNAIVFDDRVENFILSGIYSVGDYTNSERAENARERRRQYITDWLRKATPLTPPQ